MKIIENGKWHQLIFELCEVFNIVYSKSSMGRKAGCFVLNRREFKADPRLRSPASDTDSKIEMVKQVSFVLNLREFKADPRRATRFPNLTVRHHPKAGTLLY